MRKTPLNTSKLKYALRRLKPLKVCLIAIAASACQGAPKFPVTTVWETDIENGVCGEYQVVDFENMKVRHVKDWPLIRCDGVFGFSTRDIPKVLRWGEQTQNYAKDHCK